MRFTGWETCDPLELAKMLPVLDLYSLHTAPAQHLVMADAGSAVDI